MNAGLFRATLGSCARRAFFSQRCLLEPRRNEPKSSAIVFAPCRPFANIRAQGSVLCHKTWEILGSGLPFSHCL